MHKLLMLLAFTLVMNIAEAKRALVTGGAGFLGSHLCDRLIAQGDEVICIDNLFTGSMDKIQHLLDNPRFTFIQHDVTEPLEENFKVDEIYALACPASPDHYQKDPVKTMKTSVLGALFVLEIAKRCNAKVFQASTSEVYGDPLEHPQREAYWGNVNPIGIRSCYDEGKRCAETLFFDYWRMHGVKIKVARIFNTYGPRMDPQDGRVVSNFIVQALNNKPIAIYGSGEQTRSFCYVDDLINGIMALMQSPDEVTGPINLGTTQEFTVGQLAKMVVSLTESQSEIIYKPLPLDDPKMRRPQLDKSKELLDWQPSIDIYRGLQSTIDYFRKVI